MFVKPSLRADGRGYGGEPVGAGLGQLLAVELAEPFFLAESVELGRDDRGGVLVGRPAELGVELQRGGAFGVAESPGDGVQVDAGREQLGSGVVPEFFQ